MKEVVTVKNLSVLFKGNVTYEAVTDVSFRIEKGKTLALIGASGSGKSVTSLALMNLLPTNAIVIGEVQLEGKNLLTLKDKTWQKVRGNKIAMIFQEPMSALNPIKKVGEQLIENIITHQKKSKREAEEIAKQWFEKVRLPNPESIGKRYPHQLSGGQKQRVMIAMAMCNHPVLLIADEPTTALDVTVQQEIVILMKQLQEEYNTAMLFITHDLRLANKIADDYLVMEKGKVITNNIKIKEWNFKENEKRDDDKDILSVEKLSVVFEEKNWRGKVERATKAVDNVSFKIKNGETIGLVGESGCGKSTISKTILGLQEVTSGTIYFNGKKITNYSQKEWRKVRREIQIIFQDPYASLNPRMKIGEAIAEPIINIIKNEIYNTQRVKERVFQLLESVHLTKESYNKYPHEFSGGQRQRICIARALAVEPKLIICDESVAALDITTQEQVLKLLKELQQKEKLTYLFITHDLNIVKAISDRIIVMEKGRIVESGLTNTVMNDPQNKYTKKLLEAAL